MKSNHNPYIEEQTKQWSKEKVQQNTQRYTKHAHKTEDRVTRTSLRTKLVLSVFCILSTIKGIHITVCFM